MCGEAYASLSSRARRLRNPGEALRPPGCYHRLVSEPPFLPEHFCRQDERGDHYAGGWDRITAWGRSPRLGFPSEPLYAVWAHTAPIDEVTKQ